MRFHTAISAKRTTPPSLSINVPPNPDSPAEVEISFGGLGVWLTEPEATALGQRLVETGIHMRGAAVKQEGADTDA